MRSAEKDWRYKMEIMKKLLALLVTLVLCLTVFVGCGDSDSDADNDNSNDDSGNVSDVNETAAESGFYDADGNKLLNSDDVFMTVNGYDITFDEYRYWYNMVDSYFSGGDVTFWESYPDYFATLLDYSEYYVLESNWANLLAQTYGVEMTDEDLETVESYLAEEKAYFETEEEYYAALESAGFTEELLVKIITNQVLSNRVYEELYHKEGALLLPTDDQLKQKVHDEYVRVYHVLISSDHFADLEGYEDYTEEELSQAALDLANDLLAQINNGEADIYELAQSVGDDPGMEDNEAGYLFTTGEMVQEFEDTSFALEVGEISGLVESSYGWHIIQRLEQDEYVEANWETVRETVANAIFNEEVNELLDNAEIVYNDAYENFTYSSVK